MHREVKSIRKIAENRYEVESPNCPFCETTLKVEVTGPEIFQYHQGADAKIWLTRFNADVREQFMSGLCPSCWDGMAE